MKKGLWTVLAILVVGLAVYGIWFYYYRLANEENEILASGNIEATEVSVSSEVGGKVSQVLVDEGEQVNKGDVLVKLDDKILRDQVSQAEAGVDAAEAGVDEAEDGTEAEKDVARAQLKQAQISLEMARTQLKYATICSPLDGVIITKSVEVGEVVSPGSTLMVLGDLSEVELTIYVPEDEVGRIKLDQSGVVKVDSYPNEEFRAKVSHISSEAEFTPSNIETKEQRVKMVFAVTLRLSNPGRKLKSGMPADVSIKTE